MRMYRAHSIRFDPYVFVCVTDFHFILLCVCSHEDNTIDPLSIGVHERMMRECQRTEKKPCSLYAIIITQCMFEQFKRMLEQRKHCQIIRCVERH